jgi:hypothetical protein
VDAEAAKIADLVGEACGLVAGVDAGARGLDLVAELLIVRGRLLDLASRTCDPQAADAASGVAADLDQALGRVEQAVRPEAA